MNVKYKSPYLVIFDKKIISLILTHLSNSQLDKALGRPYLKFVSRLGRHFLHICVQCEGSNARG